MLIEQPEFIDGLIVFAVFIIVLMSMVLAVQMWLRRKRRVKVVINQNHVITLDTGEKLLQALAEKEIYLPTACGGNAKCGQCKLIVKHGGGSILLPEQAKLTPEQIKQHYRLACQITVKNDLEIEIPPELLRKNEWSCVVASNRSVATFIKELVLELPPGRPFNFRAGGYILLEAPACSVNFKDFDIAEKFRPAWDKLNLWRYQVTLDESTRRAYSMANYPDEKGIIMLNVRISLPPAENPERPPGKVSSYVFSLKPGDKVNVSGPFGEFYARDTENEMIFVGGGSGMAPMRSHIFDQLKRLKTQRKISYWYGARSLAEVFYRQDFDRLAKEHENFSWTIGLSDPQPEDAWQGPTGFIHQILYEHYLKSHPAPEDCEYYLCGPPPMINAVQDMLNDLGVDENNILFDKFGE